MNTFTVRTMWCDYENCYFILNQYANGTGLAIDIVSDEEGPIARLTVSVGNPSKENAAFLDTNNCPWAIALVTELGIANPTGNTARSGFCIYPEFEFDTDKLQEYAV